MSFSIRILCFDQDDPKKCTAKRLERFNLSDNHSSFKTLPPMGIVLDPFSEKVLSKEDIPLAKEIIRKCRRQLASLSDKDRNDAVFQTNLMMFPLTKIDDV